MIYISVLLVLCYYISILLCGSVNVDPGLESLRNVISVKNNAGQTGYELCRCSVARVMVIQRWQDILLRDYYIIILLYYLLVFYYIVIILVFYYISIWLGQFRSRPREPQKRDLREK